MYLIGRSPRQGTIRRSRKVRAAPFRPPWKIAAALIAACLLLASYQAQAQTCLRVTDRYDAGFRQAVHRYWAVEFPSADWRLLQAQCYAESSLDAFAVSPAGAVGLCQFMEATWREVIRRMDLRGAHRRYWMDSIEAAAYYMSDRARFWSSPRPEYHRWQLAAASYNSGAGNWYKAQVRYGGQTWAELVPHIGEFVGESNEREASEYVIKIEDFYGRLSACGRRR